MRVTEKRASKTLTEVRVGIQAGHGDMEFARLVGVGIILKGHHIVQALATGLVKLRWRPGQVQILKRRWMKNAGKGRNRQLLVEAPSRSWDLRFEAECRYP